MDLTRRLAWSLAVLAMAAIGPLGPGAAAQEYPVESGDLEVAGDDNGSMPAVDPGDSITLAGGGFEPGGTVTLTIESDPVTLGTTVADANGNIDVAVKIPVDMEPGTHTLKATGPAPGGGTVVLSQRVGVAGEGETARGAPLAFTGTGSAGLAAGAVALMAVGGGLVVTARRRRSTT